VIACRDNDEQRKAVRAAVTEALGGAYDCTRVWEAWQVGTMGPDDFMLVAEDDDRVAEIADAAIEALRPTAPPAPAVVPVAVSERPWEREGWRDAEGRCWWGRPSEELCNSDWFLATRDEVEDFCSECMPIVSLPHNAIPLPQAGEVEA
jgi:hypothetical protein